MQIWRVSRALEVPSTGSLPTNIKVGDEGEITQVKGLLLHSWIREDKGFLSDICLCHRMGKTDEGKRIQIVMCPERLRDGGEPTCLLREHLRCR